MAARVVFMGSPAFAVPALNALAERPDLAHVVGVVTQPDKPAGRGQKQSMSAVKTTAVARGIPVLQPTKLKPPESVAELAALKPDLAVVAAYGRILPRSWLETPPMGCVNLHASLLPRWRGASPINHAIMEGDRESGVAIMRMEEGLDTGPYFAMRALPIAADDTTGSLTVKLADLGAKLLIEILPQLLRGELTPTPQPDAGVTFAPLLDKEDGWLDFQLPAAVLERRIRGLAPWPSAFTEKAGLRVQVLRAHVTGTKGPPGEVLSAGSAGVCVGTGDGALVLDEVKPAGKAAMSAAAWAAGRGVVAGERFVALPQKPASA